jgi:hypothetical protein
VVFLLGEILRGPRSKHVIEERLTPVPHLLRYGLGERPSDEIRSRSPHQPGEGGVEIRHDVLTPSTATIGWSDSSDMYRQSR